MFCKSCGFDLGQQPPKFCPSCGVPLAAKVPDPEPVSEIEATPQVAPETVPEVPAPAVEQASVPIPETEPEAVVNEPEPEPVPDAELLQEASSPAPLVEGKAGVDSRLVMGGAALLLALALGGVWWVLGKKAPQSESPVVAPGPAQAPTAPVPDSSPVPLTQPSVQEAAAEAAQEPAPPKPAKEAPKPRVKPEERKPKVEEKPPTRAPAPVESGWLQRMRQDLDNCQGAFFCREKVRWKYCEGRWNTVPECRVNN